MDLPKRLIKYQTADFAAQQKVKFVYYLCIAAILFMIPIIVSTIYVQLESNGGFYFPVILAEIFVSLLFIIYLILLIKGYFQIAANLFLISSLVCIWSIVLMDKGDILVRLDTVVFVLAALTMSPLLVNKSKKLIIVYTLSNIVILFVITMLISNQLEIPASTITDFSIDTSIAILFIGVVSYNIYNINKKSLDKATFDIEERRKAEENLRISEEGYRLMFEKNPQPMMIYDIENLDIIEVNLSATRHYGYTREEFQTLNLKDIRPIEDISNFLIAINKVNSDFSNHILSKHVKKNGDIIFVNISSHTVFYKNRNARHIVITDITEQRNAETALANSEKKYRELAELLPQTIFEADLLGKLTYVNKSAFEQFGYNQTDIVQGIDILSTIDEKERQTASESIRQIIYSVPSLGSRYTALRKDGSKFPVHIFSAPIVENNKPIGLRGIIIDVSQQVQAEEALKKSRDQFESLVSNIPGVTYRCLNDSNWTMLFISSEIDSLSGYPATDFIGNRILSYKSMIHPEDRDEVNNLINKAIEENLPWEVEYRIINREGSSRWVYEKGRPQFNKMNQVDFLDGFILDITDRKKAEETAAKSNLRYLSALEALPIGCILADTQGQVYYVNKTFTRMFGYTIQDIINSNAWFELAYPDIEYRKFVMEEWELDNKKLQENNTDRKPQIYEVTTKSGEQKTIEFIQNFFEGELLVLFSDISFRKKAEEELKLSEELFRTLIANAPNAIFVSDMEGRYQIINNTFTRDTGYSLEDIIGRHPEEIGLYVDKEIKEIILDEISKKGYVQNIETTIVDKSGNRIDLLYSSNLIQLEGNPAILSSTINITEKKKIERELDKYRNELENLVKERTDELASANEELRMNNEELIAQREELETTLTNLQDAQNRLLQSEKMASLGVLAAGIAHEINNPLNFINGGIMGLESYFAEHLQDHFANVATMLDGIHTGVTRAATIVTSLSHYSRKDDLLVEKCDIHAIIDNCLIMLHNQIKNRIEIEKGYSKADFLLICNEGKLHQAILNILSNAVHSIQNKGIINISTRLKETKLQIIISDNGCGISKEHLHKILDPFFTTKAPGKGTGLGLSITYNIIQEHGGTLEFDSEINKGTKVIVTLPVR